LRVFLPQVFLESRPQVFLESRPQVFLESLLFLTYLIYSNLYLIYSNLSNSLNKTDGVLWERYIWEGPVTDIETYIETDRDQSKAVFVPGIGCTVNSIMDMNNIESTHGSTYDTAGLHRSKDAGSGAFSPYHASETTAVTDIPAGSELFASYGDYWIPLIPGAQVTLDETMDQADAFLRKEFYPFIQQHASMSDAVKQGMWELTQKDFPYYSKAYSVLPNVPWSKVEQVMQELSQTESIVRHFIRQQSIRTPEWLNKYGRCQDHIQPGRSTIEQAGRGAFAFRHLPKGTIVGYAPLVHIGYYGKEILNIEYDDNDDSDDDDSDDKVRQQYDLIINYSFGHVNSTVFLTPYGGMVNYINHQSKESNRANVKVRWPKEKMVAHKPDWLTKDIPFLRDTVDKIGLSFEYIALRDIQEGEEIFMDYGDEWEEAWNNHVQKWTPPVGAAEYVHTSEWKKEPYFRTNKELVSNPYPPNFIMMCQESFHVGPGGVYEWVPVLRQGPERVYCTVLERSESTSTTPSASTVYSYTVSMKVADGDEIQVQGVPESGIFLYDKAFSADWHLSNAFRHPIAIPDDILPVSWMNLPEVEEQ
jgi:hypothetical protein